ncbi:hypothetical protein HDV03_001903 [Kappamyces sp. JEL0829]|nr:hypothetical protein HDV03_001903 [Kappamyces sp. JEL0829]
MAAPVKQAAAPAKTQAAPAKQAPAQKNTPAKSAPGHATDDIIVGGDSINNLFKESQKQTTGKNAAPVKQAAPVSKPSTPAPKTQAAPAKAMAAPVKQAAAPAKAMAAPAKIPASRSDDEDFEFGLWSAYYDFNAFLQNNPSHAPVSREMKSAAPSTSTKQAAAPTKSQTSNTKQHKVQAGHATDDIIVGGDSINNLFKETQKSAPAKTQAAPAPKTQAAPAKTQAAPAPKAQAAPAKTQAAPAPKTQAAPAPKTQAAPAPKAQAAPAKTQAAPAPKAQAAPAKTQAAPAPKTQAAPAKTQAAPAPATQAAKKEKSNNILEPNPNKPTAAGLKAQKHASSPVTAGPGKYAAAKESGKNAKDTAPKNTMEAKKADIPAMKQKSGKAMKI